MQIVDWPSTGVYSVLSVLRVLEVVTRRHGNRSSAMNSSDHFKIEYVIVYMIVYMT